MSVTIKPDKMSSTIMSLLEDYAEDVVGATEKAIDSTARKTVKQLHNYRPAGAEAYGKWDVYLKGWTSSLDKTSRYDYTRIVYNKKRYMLAHLLEKGHRDKSGRDIARPFPHIQIAEDKAKKLVEQELEREISKL